MVRLIGIHPHGEVTIPAVQKTAEIPGLGTLQRISGREYHEDDNGVRSFLTGESKLSIEEEVKIGTVLMLRTNNGMIWASFPVANEVTNAPVPEPMLRERGSQCDCEYCNYLRSHPHRMN